MRMCNACFTYPDTMHSSRPYFFLLNCPETRQALTRIRRLKALEKDYEKKMQDGNLRATTTNNLTVEIVERESIVGWP